jgi:hypothetical protein
MGPQDPNAPTWACKTVKKLVINVDDLEDAGDEAPSPATDLVAQRDRFVSFRLLEWITEALERLSPRQEGVVPTEGPAAEGTEAVPVVEQGWTPLFLMDSDLMDLLFALEAGKDSEEESGHSSGNRNEGNKSENEGSGSEDGNDGSFGAMDGDAMVE